MDYEFRQAGHVSDATAAQRARLKRMGKLTLIPGMGHLAVGAPITGVVFVAAAGGLLYGLFTDVLPFYAYFPLWLGLYLVSGRDFMRVAGRTMAADLMLASAAPENASTACPRCAAVSAGPTGLCAGCFGALTPSHEGSRLIAAQVAAVNSGNARLERSTTRYPYTAHDVATGRSYELTRSSGAALIRTLRAAFPDLQVESAGVFAEGTDPSVIWTLMRSRGHAVDGRVLELNRMVRLRTEGGKVTEAWDFPPLSGAVAAPSAVGLTRAA